jgi:hypothetical protein
VFDSYLNKVDIINSGAKGLTIRQQTVHIKQANPFLFNAGITVGKTTVPMIQNHCFTSLPPGTVFKPECTLPYSVCHIYIQHIGQYVFRLPVMKRYIISNASQSIDLTWISIYEETQKDYLQSE